MTRSKWKGPYVEANLFKENKKNKKIWTRSSTIPGFLIGENVLVHNGREFKRLSITRDKVGFKFGEFSFTRKFVPKPKSTQTSIKKK
jgi:small subunit ribosomal protein S19